MANYAGLSYGTNAYCGTAIQPFLTPSNEITGITCFQIHNGAATGSTITLNGQDVVVGGNSTLDIIINSVGALQPWECLICSCYDCNNPDGNAQRATYSGSTINPASPYTLIGMGFLQN